MTGRMYGNYQLDIYRDGLRGVLPEFPLTAGELEASAREKLDPGAFGYVAGGAGEETTMRANRAAFDHWRIVPRMLRDVSSRDLHVTVLGTEMPAPIMLAPVGVLSIVHPEAETAVARAAAGLGLPMVLSTASSRSMEEIGRVMGKAPRCWMHCRAWSRLREAGLCSSTVASGREVMW